MPDELGPEDVTLLFVDIGQGVQGNIIAVMDALDDGVFGRVRNGHEIYMLRIRANKSPWLFRRSTALRSPQRPTRQGARLAVDDSKVSVKPFQLTGYGERSA